MRKIIQMIRHFRAMQRVNLGLSRAAVGSHLRKLDPTLPNSWEFSGFSQNGEDGIIDYLCSQLKESNRYFVEIGAADGLENNTAWLAIAKKYSGLMVEGCSSLALRQQGIIPSLNLGVQCLSCYVTHVNVESVIQKMLYRNPDVFSIDIDGNDYHILKLFLEKGIRPKIVVVEYNSAFGPESALTIPYQMNFDYTVAHASQLYYGVSIMAWKKLLLNQFGYQFVTVEKNGVNAFFVDPDCFSEAWLTQIKPLHFSENFFQLRKFSQAWYAQFEKIKDQKFEEVLS